jgi:hypothetical protein
MREGRRIVLQSDLLRGKEEGKFGDRPEVSDRFGDRDTEKKKR